MDLNHRPHAYQACALTETELQAPAGTHAESTGCLFSGLFKHLRKITFKDQLPDLSKLNSDGENRVLP
jgi:hypothetical protein